MDAQESEDWQTVWGNDREFAELFDSFLDAVYPTSLTSVSGSGRQDLVSNIAAEVRRRGATRVLDCAAGIGFPALDLVHILPEQFTVHATDASPQMLGVMKARAKRLGVDLGNLAALRRGVADTPGGLDRFLLAWSELHQIEDVYDYLICRGNSLAYASSWIQGSRKVASLDVIKQDLKQMKARIRPGGYLHVDAPRRLDLSTTKYAPVVSGAVSIEEEVKVEEHGRQWEVDFILPTGQRINFDLYSTKLTVYDVQTMLDEIGFEETKPIELPGERPGFGVIIARNPG